METNGFNFLKSFRKFSRKLTDGTLRTEGRSDNEKDFVYMEIYLTNMNQMITNMTRIHTSTSDVSPSSIKAGMLKRDWKIPNKNIQDSRKSVEDKPQLLCNKGTQVFSDFTKENFRETTC